VPGLFASKRSREAKSQEEVKASLYQHGPFSESVVSVALVSVPQESKWRVP